MKRLLLSIGSIVSTATPVVAVVSCGRNTIAEQPTITTVLKGKSQNYNIEKQAIKDFINNPSHAISLPKPLVEFATVAGDDYTLDGLARADRRLASYGRRFALLDATYRSSQTYSEVQKNYIDLQDMYGTIMAYTAKQWKISNVFREINAINDLPSIASHVLSQWRKNIHTHEWTVVPESDLTPEEATLMEPLRNYFNKLEEYETEIFLSKAKEMLEEVQSMRDDIVKKINEVYTSKD